MHRSALWRQGPPRLHPLQGRDPEVPPPPFPPFPPPPPPTVDYIRFKGATLRCSPPPAGNRCSVALTGRRARSIGGKLVSQIQLKREHWEEVIDSLNFALSGQGCRKDGHGLGKNARAFFNYCSVLPKRDHKYRDWNDLTWSFDEANVADIQNVKIWQRGYQKRRREEKRMEEGGSVSDVDDKCVAKVREEPPEEAKKPKARAPKAASEAAKVAPAMPSREDVSALMTLHQACLLASKAEQVSPPVPVPRGCVWRLV